jgi:hypothetical protein
MARPKAVVREIAATTRATALALAPLIQPYRKLGKVSLRVERMQRFARLSRGRNNGDGSWSLASDELDDLEYLCTEGTPGEHTLSIRVVALDNGDTLAVLDYPLSLSATRALDADESAAAAGRAPAQSDHAQTAKRPENSEALKAVLAEREAEFAELRKTIQAAEAEITRKIATAVGSARDSWKVEMEQHLQTVRSASELEGSRNAWFAEQLAQLTEAKERSEKQFAETQERIRRDADEARAKAEAVWKASEAERLAKAEADWREKSTGAVAELKARCERAENALTEASARAEAEWREKTAKAVAEAKTQCERAEKALADAAARAEAAVKRDEREQARLAQELATARAALADREAGLAKMRVSIDQVEAELPRKIASAVAQAREGWKSELEHHLAAAAARSAAEFEQSRGSWLAEQTALLAELKKQAAEQLAGAHEHWRRETEEAHEKAQAVWKTAEAERLSRSESEWRERAAKTAAELKARCERVEKDLADASARTAASSKPDEREHGRLMAELATARTGLADREAELAEMRKAKERVEAEIPDKIAAALAAAREEWKTELHQQVAESRNTWLAAHNTLLVDAKKRADDELAEARERWRKNEEEMQIKTAAAWKQAESDHLAKAEADWRESSQKAAADLEAKCRRAEAALEKALAAVASSKSGAENLEHGRLIEELATMRVAFADREAELAHTRSAAEQALERVRQDADAAIAKAKSEWTDAEQARVASAEAQWRQQSLDALAKAEEVWRKNSADALAAATARFEHAEAELAQLHAETESEGGHDGEGVVRRLRDKIAVLQATLAEREKELAHARLSMETRIPASRPKTFQQRDPERSSSRPVISQQTRKSSRLPRDIIAVGLIAAVAVVILPRWEDFIPESVWNMFGMTTQVVQAPQTAPTPPVPQPPNNLEANAPLMATIVRSVNVRSDSSKAADIVATLERGVTVAVIGQHGNWTKVRLDADKTKVQQGWIYNSFLKAAGGDGGAPRTAKNQKANP